MVKMVPLQLLYIAGHLQVILRRNPSNYRERGMCLTPDTVMLDTCTWSLVFTVHPQSNLLFIGIKDLLQKDTYLKSILGVTVSISGWCSHGVYYIGVYIRVVYNKSHHLSK